MMYDWGGGDNGYGIWGFVFMFVVMALLVIGIVVVVRYLSHSNSGQREEEALNVLKKRYANGEIDQKEFEQKRKDLSK